MTYYRQSRLRAFLLAAIVAAGAGLHCRADVVSNCFKVVNYTVNWHVECTLDGFTDAHLHRRHPCLLQGGRIDGVQGAP